MSEAPDPLEAELSALRPQPVSPGLRRRVARRLGDDPRGLTPPARHRRRWWFALAAGLAAACLAAVLLWWGSGRRTEPEPIVVQPRPRPPSRVEGAEPTLLAYQRALARSPEDLDALLDKQAVAAPEPNPELVRIRAFTRSDAALHALLGEE
jgi:hypothetical protein